MVLVAVQDNGMGRTLCRVTAPAASSSASPKVCRVAPGAEVRVAAELLQACSVLWLTSTFLPFVLDPTSHHPATSCSGTVWKLEWVTCLVFKTVFCLHNCIWLKQLCRCPSTYRERHPLTVTLGQNLGWLTSLHGTAMLSVGIFLLPLQWWLFDGMLFGLYFGVFWSLKGNQGLERALQEEE